MFGTTVFGHGGGVNEFLSNLVFIPEIEASVFIAQNGGVGAQLPLLVPTEILGALASDAGLGGPAREPVPDAALRAAEASGRYLTNRRTFSGPGQFLAALSPLVVTALPDGALLMPTPVSQWPVRHEPIAPTSGRMRRARGSLSCATMRAVSCALLTGPARKPMSGYAAWPIRSGSG